MSVKVGINGFGRIGKLAFQAAFRKRGGRGSSSKRPIYSMQTTWHI